MHQQLHGRQTLGRFKTCGFMRGQLRWRIYQGDEERDVKLGLSGREKQEVFERVIPQQTPLISAERLREDWDIRRRKQEEEFQQWQEREERRAKWVDAQIAEFWQRIRQLQSQHCTSTLKLENESDLDGLEGVDDGGHEQDGNRADHDDLLVQTESSELGGEFLVLLDDQGM